MGLGQLDTVEGFGEGTNLVYLDQDRIGGAGVDAFLEEFDVGHEKVITDELGGLADLVGQEFPGSPVVFGAAVLDGNDWITLLEVRIIVHDFRPGLDGAVGFLKNVGVLILVVEFRSGAVQGDEDLLAEFVTGLVHGFGDHGEGVVGAL